MHLSKNFFWTLGLADNELLVLIKLLRGADLNEDEEQLANHLEEILPMIRDKQLDTRPSATRQPINGFRRPRFNNNGRANHNGNGILAEADGNRLVPTT